MTTSSLDSLADQLRAAAAAYYDGTEELMSDAEYDDGIEQLRTAAASDPDLAMRVADLLGAVAGGQSAGGDVEHPTLMGSLDKVVGLDAVEAFVAKVPGPVVVEPKLDGLPVRAVYTNGILTLAATRGDGRHGENVTAAVKSLKVTGLPRWIVDPGDGRGLPALLEVRGEIVLCDSDFPLAQNIRAEQGEQPFVNQRNAAAGILRKGDPAFAGLLTFAAYGATFGDTSTETWTHASTMGHIERYGFGTARSMVPGVVFGATQDIELVLADIDHLGTNRATLGFPIDGAVIKAATVEGRTALGEGDRAPRWAVAYKYEAETAVTRVVGITTAVGRTGRLAIRIEVEPVFVGGTTVTFATGHNVAWMAQRDVRVGDTVTIKRANDVIPYIVSVDTTARPADSQPWTPPATDPNGGEWDKSTLLWRSTDPSLSVGATLRYAVSRDALDIYGMGTEVIDALVETGLVSRLTDLWSLTAEQLADLPLDKGRRLGEKNAAKILGELDKARTAPWARVITALGLRMTGRTMSRRLAAVFPNLRALASATITELAAVDGVGDVKATVIAQELARLNSDGGPGRDSTLVALAKAGVNTGARTAAEDLADLLPLGFTERDPHRNVFEAADAILAAGFVGDRDTLADAIPLGYDARDSYTDTLAAARDLLARGIVRVAAVDGPAKPLDGMTVVVSGSVPGYSRTTVAELIEAKGGRASSSVSATTSLLVSEPSTSSKYVKAEKLGVRIVTPAEFLEMIA